MRIVSILLATSLLVDVSPAAAAGYINLGWNDCAALSTPTVSEGFPCTSNTGTEILIASFQPPVLIPALNGADGTIDVQTNQAVLSPWWHMESGGCRQTMATTNWDFTAGPFTCLDPWQGFTSAGLVYTVGNLGPNTARIRAVGALPSGLEAPADPAYEYYAYKVLIRHGKSVGNGSCAGCTDAACFLFSTLTLYAPGGAPSYTLTAGPQVVVIWQGGVGTNCNGATPVRPRTWGQIKVLYR